MVLTVMHLLAAGWAMLTLRTEGVSAWTVMDPVLLLTSRTWPTLVFSE